MALTPANKSDVDGGWRELGGMLGHVIVRGARAGSSRELMRAAKLAALNVEQLRTKLESTLEHLQQVTAHITGGGLRVEG